MPPKTRAEYYKKEKPAERELLTAGVSKPHEKDFLAFRKWELNPRKGD